VNDRSLFDLVDSEDRFVRRGTRSDAARHGLWRRAVHIFVFNNRGELLVCRRPDHLRAYPGLFTSSAGGRVESGETYADAAIRELSEELAVHGRLRDVGMFEVENHDHGQVRHRLFVTEAESFRPDPDEIASCSFVGVSELIDLVGQYPDRYAEPFRRALELYLRHHNVS
jgi:8-oxo-dGTP pyrophosphatase MutT (NUDIX family)